MLEVEGDWPRGIGLLEQAVALDSTFAMAWRKLSVELGNGPGNLADEIHAIEAAYRHRDRLTERERYLVESTYAGRVEYDAAEGIAALKNLLALDPEDRWATNNIGFFYYVMGDWEQAETWYGRAAALDTADDRSLGNLAVTKANMGKTDEAAALFERIMARTDRVGMTMWHGAFRASRGEYDDAVVTFASIADNNAQIVPTVAAANEWQAYVRDSQGRFAEADGLYDEAVALYEATGPEAVPDYHETVRARAWRALFVTHDTAAALALVEEALTRYPLEDLERLDRPASEYAELIARAGRPAEARAMLDPFVAELTPTEARVLVEDLSYAEAGIAHAEGRVEDARAAYERGHRVSMCVVCKDLLLAELYDDAGVPDSAIAYYVAYVDDPWNFRFFVDGSGLGPSLERLGQLYEQQGDLMNAAVYYARFVELWKDADPELQPRVQAAQARLEEIVRQQG